MSRTYTSRKTRKLLDGVWFDNVSASTILGTVYNHFYPNDKGIFPYEMGKSNINDFSMKVNSLTKEDWKILFEKCKNCWSPTLTGNDMEIWVKSVCKYLRRLKDGYSCLG